MKKTYRVGIASLCHVHVHNVARWFLGEQANAGLGLRANLNSPGSDAEDDGMIVARFSKAVGIFEVSWTTLEPGVPSGPVVYGTEGTLIVDVQLRAPSGSALKLEVYAPPIGFIASDWLGRVSST